MVSSDTLGYPLKKHFYRIHLENAWIAAFGALDIGDFETFLKESADRTYPGALAQIKKMGAGASEASHIRESKELVEQGSIDQYRGVAEGLRKEGKEYEASALDAAIADLITAQSQPRPQRKTQEKRERKDKPLIPAEKKSITEICKQSPLDRSDIEKIIKGIEIKDIPDALRRIKECPPNTLDEFDKFELEELLNRKAMGITEPTKEYVHKEPAKPILKKQIISAREVIEKKEKEEEQVMPFQAVEYEYQTINLQNAKLFLRDYQKYLPGMLQTGLQKWLETHRTAFKFPLTTHNLEVLSNALEYAIVPSKVSIRGVTATEFMQRYAYLIMIQGIDIAAKSYDWQAKYNYYKDTLKTDMPLIEKFKTDVLATAKKISFSFQ